MGGSGTGGGMGQVNGGFRAATPNSRWVLHLEYDREGENRKRDERGRYNEEKPTNGNRVGLSKNNAALELAEGTSKIC